MQRNLIVSVSIAFLAAWIAAGGSARADRVAVANAKQAARDHIDHLYQQALNARLQSECDNFLRLRAELDAFSTSPSMVRGIALIKSSGATEAELPDSELVHISAYAGDLTNRLLKLQCPPPQTDTAQTPQGTGRQSAGTGTSQPLPPEGQVPDPEFARTFVPMSDEEMKILEDEIAKERFRQSVLQSLQGLRIGPPTSVQGGASPKRQESLLELYFMPPLELLLLPPPAGAKQDGSSRKAGSGAISPLTGKDDASIQRKESTGQTQTDPGPPVKKPREADFYIAPLPGLKQTGAGAGLNQQGANAGTNSLTPASPEGTNIIGYTGPQQGTAAPPGFDGTSGVAPGTRMLTNTPQPAFSGTGANAPTTTDDVPTASLPLNVNPPDMQGSGTTVEKIGKKKVKKQSGAEQATGGDVKKKKKKNGQPGIPEIGNIPGLGGLTGGGSLGEFD